MAGPALAQYEVPNVLTISGDVVPGGTVTLSGSGCVPGETVAISVDGASIGSTIADAEGDFDASLQVPSDAEGSVTFTAVCGAEVFTLTVDVLAATGSDTKSMLYIAFAAIMAGGLLFALGKRRAVVSA